MTCHSVKSVLALIADNALLYRTIMKVHNAFTFQTDLKELFSWENDYLS